MAEKSSGAPGLQSQIAGWESKSLEGSFEEAMEALEAIVRLLDQGNLALADSVRCFEIGTRLSERCQQLLEAAELQVSLLAAAPEYDDDDGLDPWMTGSE